MEQKICSFFGHRDAYGDYEERLHQRIRFAVDQYGVTTFYVGGNGAFDRTASGAIKQLKREYPDIQLYLTLAYLPVRLLELPPYYSGSIFFEGLESVHRKGAITMRNRIMAEVSDIIICYIHHNHGGAYAATNYAYRQGKIILNCAQSDLFLTRSVDDEVGLP